MHYESKTSSYHILFSLKFQVYCILNRPKYKNISVQPWGENAVKKMHTKNYIIIPSRKKTSTVFFVGFFVGFFQYTPLRKVILAID